MFNLGVSLRSASFIFAITGFFFTGMLEDGTSEREDDGVEAEVAETSDEEGISGVDEEAEVGKVEADVSAAVMSTTSVSRMMPGL